MGTPLKALVIHFLNYFRTVSEGVLDEQNIFLTVLCFSLKDTFIFVFTFLTALKWSATCQKNVNVICFWASIRICIL